jgi:hypothetical protein
VHFSGGLGDWVGGGTQFSVSHRRRERESQ